MVSGAIINAFPMFPGEASNPSMNGVSGGPGFNWEATKLQEAIDQGGCSFPRLGSKPIISEVFTPHSRHLFC